MWLLTWGKASNLWEQYTSKKSTELDRVTKIKSIIQEVAHNNIEVKSNISSCHHILFVEKEKWVEYVQKKFNYLRRLKYK